MKKLLLHFLFILMSIATINAQSIGIIGDATPGGWDNDTDMEQDAVDTSLWTITITLTNATAKFRMNDAWDVNWGSTDFPCGTGEQDGPNIPVFAGDYHITFNSATGEYCFEVMSDIGVIGDATPGGWDSDTDMYKDPADSCKFFTVIDLGSGAVKFRKDNDWAVNWGNEGFPTDTAFQDGPNVPIEKAGRYRIDFDTCTGVYLFEEEITFQSIGLIGSATAGGWDVDTNLVQDSNDPNVWRGTFDLMDGEAKFRANDEWVYDWGGDTFPSGVGTAGGPNIPVVAGRYLVDFNTDSGEYNFQEIVPFMTIGIIGDATPGGWADDTDLEAGMEEGTWNGRLILSDGEAKFRADDDWMFNWGAGDFPEGIGVQDGANIPVTGGEYKIQFNSTTGYYLFEEIVVYDTVGIIGTGTEFANWDNDVFMYKTPDNEELFWKSPVTLVDGEIKFRANGAWAVNWGNPEFPAGNGVQDGPNILCAGGTYTVTINTTSGDYAFDSSLDTEDLLDPATIKAYPNPTQDMLNVDVTALGEGPINLRLLDMSGRLVKNQVQSYNDILTMDLSGVQKGSYILQISNGSVIVGKHVSVF